MAKRKIKLTRTELKLQRDALARFERYLPTLKLKQQQVQSSIVQAKQAILRCVTMCKRPNKSWMHTKACFNDVAGINVRTWPRPNRSRPSTRSVAGIKVPVFEGVTFGRPEYSLFGTAPWVDRAVLDLREVNRLNAELGHTPGMSGYVASGTQESDAASESL